MYRDPIIIGRDILNSGVRVELDNNNLTITAIEKINTCQAQESKINFNMIDTDLTGNDRLRLTEILNKYTDYFIKGIPKRRVQTGKMEIKLQDPQKVVTRSPYRLAPAEKLTVRQRVQELLDAGVIRESSSAFASPILLVKKKDGIDRFCVDYRHLNVNTIPEHFSLPLIEEQIDKLTGANLFSSLDMASGFHQI